MSWDRSIRWPAEGAVAVLDEVVPPEVEEIVYSAKVVEAAVDAADDAVTYDYVEDYGWGGETYSREVVDNWPEVVQAVLTGVLASGEEFDWLSLGSWPHGAYQMRDTVEALVDRFGPRFAVDASGDGPIRITPLSG